MIEQLFGSKTRVKLLKLFYSNPNRSFYVREITRKIDEQINSVRRELSNMLSLGLITSDSNDNKLYYEVNQDYEHYDALESMFSSEAMQDTKDAEPTTKTNTENKKKVVSTKSETRKNDKQPASKPAPKDDVIELPEAKQWEKVGNVAGIAYSGAYTRDESAGVDIVVIGDVVVNKVEAVIVELEKEKKRELRYAVMEADEWGYRRQVRDKFWLQFMGAKKQIVLDKNKLFVD